MFNNIPVGWTYCTISNDQIIIPVQLNDGLTGGIENYPNHVLGIVESVVNFHFYDASEQKVYYNIFASNAVPFDFIAAGDLEITGDGTSQSGVTFQSVWQPYDLGEAVCPLAYADNFSAVGVVVMKNYVNFLISPAEMMLLVITKIY